MANQLANTYMRSGMLANKVIKNSLPVAPAANPFVYSGATIARGNQTAKSFRAAAVIYSALFTMENKLHDALGNNREIAP